MQYLMLTKVDQDQLLSTLDDMAGYLRTCFAGLSREESLRPGPNEIFSPVEQVWHLADLERDGFTVRIHRLLRETRPLLADFDGARVARERDYRSRSLTEGIVAFEEARQRNIGTLAAIRGDDWKRSGEQDGVGTLSVCDIPAMMAQHDAAHRAEIETWQQAARASV